MGMLLLSWVSLLRRNCHYKEKVFLGLGCHAATKPSCYLPEGYQSSCFVPEVHHCVIRHERIHKADHVVLAQPLLLGRNLIGDNVETFINLGERKLAWESHLLHKMHTPWAEMMIYCSLQPNTWLTQTTRGNVFKPELSQIHIIQDKRRRRNQNTAFFFFNQTVVTNSDLKIKSICKSVPK